MSEIKIACSTVAFRQLSLERALEIIRNAGFTSIETQSKGAWCPHVDIDRDDPILFAGRVKAAGIESVAALHMYEGSVIDSRAFVPYTVRAVQWAKAAGVPVLITSEGCVSDGMAPSEAQALVKERLAQAAEYASGNGIAIAIETRGHLSDDVAADFLGTMDAYSAPYLGINFDSANVHACRVDETQILDAVADRVIHFHAKDTRAGRCTALGAGDVKISECLRKLRQMRYGGYVVLETEGDEPEEEMTRMVRESYSCLTGQLG